MKSNEYTQRENNLFGDILSVETRSDKDYSNEGEILRAWESFSILFRLRTYSSNFLPFSFTNNAKSENFGKVEICLDTFPVRGTYCHYVRACFDM